MSKLKVSGTESVRKSHNLKVSENVKTGRCHKLKVSEKGKNRKVSEFRYDINQIWIF